MPVIKVTSSFSWRDREFTIMCCNGFRLWIGCELLKEFISGFVYKSGKRGARDRQSDWCSVCSEVTLYLSFAVKKE